MDEDYPRMIYVRVSARILHRMKETLLEVLVYDSETSLPQSISLFQVIFSTLLSIELSDDTTTKHSYNLKYSKSFLHNIHL